jgi:hypothetical protein
MRSLIAFKLGAWVGITIAAGLVKLDGLALLGGVAVESSAYASNSNAAQAGQ